MKKYIWFLVLSLISFLKVSGQYAFFPNSGKVTYERKFHIENFLKRNYLNKTDLNTWDKMFVDNVVKNGPTEVITKHILKFNDQETLYEEVKENYPSNYNQALQYLPWHNGSKTYVNYKTQMFSKLLPFGAEELLLEDSVPSVKWKYTDEYRNIAGYDCRRANGIIQDSIYVVAFFTNEIDIPAGPELIHGLPGLILGISVPSHNINMFATKVELTNEPVSKSLTKDKKLKGESKIEISEKLKTIYTWMDTENLNKMKTKVFF